MITQETVNYIGALARLHLENSEAVKFAKDLESILHYVEKLNALDVSGVKPTSHVLNVENVFRDDGIKPGLSQEQALAFAVDKLNGAYKVPKVIE
jgi:aspartyl-tRNA(Asn)/glutamyl-tRNA(Gln) amidotransferase subunit C